MVLVPVFVPLCFYVFGRLCLKLELAGDTDAVVQSVSATDRGKGEEGSLSGQEGQRN
jgi:hypothetical protein